MTCRGTKLLLAALAVPASVGGAWACGARTAVGLDVFGSDDGAVLDATRPDATVDARSTEEAADGAVDDAVDSATVDAPPDAPACSQPSCAPGGPGMTNCGAGSECCCTSLQVMGGTYDRTYVNKGSGVTFSADPATVSSFRLDKYEVTVGRFRQFVAAWNGGSGWLPAAGSGKHAHLNGGLGLANSASPGSYEPGWVASDDGNISLTNANLTCDATPSDATWTAAAGSQENLPINCVNWYEAYAFCIWDGGFLPSETEWEYVAAGGSAQREYPWGTTAPGAGNQYAIYGCYYPDSGPCTFNEAGGIASPTTPAPVGTPTLGAGRWGHLDLGGNVWEWTLDLPADYVNPCTDCAYLAVAPNARMIRGGDWFNPGSPYLEPAWRDITDLTGPTYREPGVGVRCARTP